MEITDFMSSTGTRNRQTYWNIAGWDSINVNEKAHDFIRGKMRFCQENSNNSLAKQKMCSSKETQNVNHGDEE